MITSKPEDAEHRIRMLGIILSPGKGSQWRNATGKTQGMPPVGIWSTGEPVVSSEDDKQDNSDI